MRRPQSGWRWPLAGALALAVTAATGGVGTAEAVSQPPPPAPVAPTESVTLLTGDRVLFGRSPEGRYEITVDPAPRDGGGTGVSFQTIDDGDQLYVLPSDAAPLVPDRLDRELFNVTKLAGYDRPDRTPVITMHGDQPAAAQRGAADAAGITTTAELPGITATAATIDGSGDWWRAGQLSGVERVWLDERVEVSLADSVPMVGAPQAWDLGYDGTGVTVAVLDTGIDADHPDLAGKVVGEQNFTESDTAGDRHGHGTHVAGIAAGTGAASDGEFTGVAPGADLLNAKVVGDDGTGLESGIIAGMEWAAEQGADVVNLSLGGPASDGTDPLSQAVNELTASHDVLFAVAAGNSGPSDHSVTSPGAADAALTVGSVNKAGELAASSGRGPRLGDFAVKPDLTAPGVDITSARADGTELGPPVGDDYTTISGTSMATPHVAGAAAILRQSEPELTAAQLKARLAGSAVPHPELDVYQQGTGVLDIPAALDPPVEAPAEPVDLGYLPHPQEELPPVTAEVTYRNRTGAPVTVALGLEVASREGATAGPEALSVEPASLTIPPGGEASATVSLDPGAAEDGLYGGYLTAAAAGEVAARTPVGFYQEPESYQLTVTGTARDGRPAAGVSTVAILDVEDMTRFMAPGNPFVDGTVQVRVPPGRYAVLGAIHTYDAHNQDIQQTAFVGDPEITVDQDTTVALDAREAAPITVATPDQPDSRPQGQVGLGFWRTAQAPGPQLGVTFLGLHAGREFYATATDPVSLGGFEFYTRWRLAAPEAELAVTDPEPVALDPILMRAPALDGEQELRLMDVGDGAAGDYSGVDAAGAAVLARRGPVPSVEQEQHAAAAGAAVLVVTNDVPGPLVGSLGVDAGSIPTLSLTEAEGEQLRSLLAGGEVTVRASGVRWSPYLYDLVLLEVGQIPEELDHVVDPAQLATIDVAYHNDVDGHPMAEARHFSRPFHSSSAYLHPFVDGPRERTEYVLGGDAMSYQQTVYGELPFEARLREPDYAFYAAGERAEQSWFRQVVRPALLPEVGLTARTGDTLDLEVYEWVDAAGNHFPELFGLEPYPGDTIAMRLFEDGELVAEADEPRGEFPMTAGPADYRIELDVAREADWWQRSTATRTAWSFDSQPGDGVLPLLTVDYLVDLDLSNGMVDPAGPLTLRVSQQTADQPAIAGAELSVSYDGGTTWTGVPLDSLGGGEFRATLPTPTGDFASLRVEAWDADDNRIEQEVIRAFGT
jgi:subtilisin family serine protease